MKEHRRICMAVIVATFLVVPFSAAAQTLNIQPALIDGSDVVEDALAKNQGRASTSIEGAGASLMLTYQASEPIEIFMVPMNDDKQFVPTDFIRFTLPQTEEGTVKIDLTVSPGWTPSSKTWLINLLTEHEGAKGGFLTIEFVDAGPFATVSASLRHLFTTEAYTPSSYHALRGYRIIGTEVTMILGVLLLITCVIVFLAAKKDRRLPAVVLVILVFSAAYQLRFGLDLLRFTTEHMSGYAAGVYDEAGSVNQIATVLNELQAQKKDGILTVHVCRSGTNYKEKMLRYFSYPVRISSSGEDAPIAEYALVMDSRDWSLVTETKGKVTTQFLECGALQRPAIRGTTFPDGSILFALPS